MMYRFWMVVCTLVFVAQCALGANKPPQCPRPPQAPTVVAKAPSVKVAAESCSRSCSCGCNEGQECGCGDAVTTTRYYTMVSPVTHFAPTFAQAPAFQPAYNYRPAFQPVSMPMMSYAGGGGFRGSRGGSCGGGG